MSSNESDHTLVQSPEQQARLVGAVGVPGYEIVGTLGRGGMGVVYKAMQTGLNRVVTLKMLIAGQYADPSARARFLLEAESVAALEHPHIVGVFAFGESGGHSYLAMEYVPGGTLAERVKANGPLPAKEATELLAKLAAAVAHAHSRGVAHRDIKPLNVLLAADGEPRLTDFGLAKVGRADQHLSVTGQVLGTPAYMAPEQAAGKTHEVGTPADVYALGAVLYDLLTGRPPFASDSVAVTLQKVISEEPARPRKVVASIPRDLETICLKCLQKEPADRYHTADALIADLKAYLGGFPVTARPVGVIRRAWKWAKRRPVRAGALATLFAVGLALGALVPRSKSTLPPVARTGVWVEADPVAAATFKVIDQEAIVDGYSGGAVNFWLELTTGGEGPARIDFVPLHGDLTWGPEGRSVAPNYAVEGTFIWVRGVVDTKDGTEEWRQGHERHKSSRTPTGGETHNLIGSTEFVKSLTDKTGKGAGVTTRHYVWSSKQLDHPWRHSSGLIHNPISVDGPVCLQEITGGVSDSLVLLRYSLRGCNCCARQ